MATMTSLFGLPRPQTTSGELSRLRAENEALIEELAQSKTDKEFVWSLWKRLQVASPDITQAVGMIIQRETEKAEAKDRKVLEILRMKDARIEELQKLQGGQTKELSDLLTKKVEYQEDIKRLKLDRENLREKFDFLQDKVRRLESEEHKTAGRQVVREMDQDLMDLKQLISRRETEVDRLEQDKTDLTSIRDSQRQRISLLEDDLKVANKRHDDLLKEHKDSLLQLSQLSSLRDNISRKDQEHQAARSELNDLWNTHRQVTSHSEEQADIIRQLRGVHGDTQKVMENQAEAHRMEITSLQAKLQAAQASELELRRQITHYRQRISELEAEASDVSSMGTQCTLESEQEESGRSQPEKIIKERFKSMQREMDSLRSRVSNSPISTCDRALSPIGRASTSPARSNNHQSRSASRSKPRRRSSPARPRSISTEVPREPGAGVVHQRLENTEKTLDRTRHMLQLKGEELEELRRAHGGRLQRLRALQADYRLIKKQLALVEEERYGPRKKRRKLRRVNPRSLQQEDSDSVWNELAFLRNENRNLTTDRINLEEEHDGLKVKVAQDAATIYELRSCLEQEREELQFLLEQQAPEKEASPDPEMENELLQTRKEVRRLRKAKKSFLCENKQLQGDLEQLSKDRRDLKSSINHLEERDAENRIKMADYRREVASLQRELKRRKKKHKVKSAISRQYQKLIGSSFRDTTNTFDELEQEDWEEVSDSEDVSADETGTSAATRDSLGQVIAGRAHRNHVGEGRTPSPPRPAPRVRPTERQLDSVENHVRRMASRDESPRREGARVASPRRKPPQMEPPADRRDVALSPIHFLHGQPITASVGTSPHVVGKKRQGAAGTRQVAALRQRIHALQQQVTILKTAKDQAARSGQEHKSLAEQLQSDLNAAQNKVQTTKLTLQRLTGDLERLKTDKAMLEKQMEDENFESMSSQHSHQDWSLLHARLKSSTNEITKQLNQIKQLRQEHSDQQQKIQKLQDRVSHLERDVSQKRTLVDDMRLKLKMAQQNAQSDADVMVDVETKIKQLSESNSRFKTQTDSLKQRISVVTKEKRAAEDKVITLSDEIDRKGKLVSDLQRRNQELSGTVTAVERAAQEQLHVLANQSERAIDTAHQRLSSANQKLLEYDKFTKVFSLALLNSIHQARSRCQQKKQDHERRKASVTSELADLDPSLRRAQTLARDILNLSQSEIDDLMSVDGDRPTSLERGDTKNRNTDDHTEDRKWTKRLEKRTQKADFALPLTELFMEKVDERNVLAVKLQDS